MLSMQGVSIIRTWLRSLGDHRIILLFDVESQIFVTMATRASLMQISMTTLNCPPSKTYRLVWCKILDCISCISRVIVNFVKISKLLLPWQHFTVNIFHCRATVGHGRAREKILLASRTSAAQWRWWWWSRRGWRWWQWSVDCKKTLVFW